MLTIAIRYLNGWAMAAADGADKKLAEWPPHPDRVFMALAAAWFETGEDIAEGAALRWLEDQDPPDIAASDADQRQVLTSYVPVNDVRTTDREPVGGPVSYDLDKLKDKGLGLLPEFRSRQPRSFPVAIPHDEVVHLIWARPLPSEHRAALDRLLTSVTHVGHSASLVQAWIADHSPEPNWISTNGLAQARLRVPYPNRLATLKQQLNRDKSLTFYDLEIDIKNTKETLREIKEAQPYRADWDEFPEVLILKEESTVKQDPLYSASKAGDAESAAAMLKNLLPSTDISRLQKFVETYACGDKPILAAVHAFEKTLNAIPSALAQIISEHLECDYAVDIRQCNIVSHTGASGYGRLARQALFKGPVEKDRTYILVDDFVGQGGTLANLRGYILKQGGHVAAAFVLTGKSYSAKIALSHKQLDELRKTHGKDLEQWWKDHFGYAFGRLTQSEARYLTRSPDVDRIRRRIITEKRPRDFQRHYHGPKAQRQRLKQLEAEREERFPNGAPASQRPSTGRWQGYRKPELQDFTEPSPKHFNSNLIILRLSGKRISLPSTLKLTGALRGALMKFCPKQPPPEWLTGHTHSGHPSKKPHLALLPLPFVSSQHADGHILGVAMVLPFGLDEQEVANCLSPFLYDKENLPVSRRLFDGEWLECNVEYETRESPPQALRTKRWTRPSRTWASVTPIVLDRHHDGKHKRQQVSDDVKTACERIGLPKPLEVMLHPVSLVEGAPSAREFPRTIRKSDGAGRNHSHAVLIFDQPVTGPVMIGAGRFRGYGLCLPMD